MGLRKAMGIILVCTQMVVAVDFNMQSRKAGLGPGELSMKDYATIVQKRYDRSDITRLAANADANQDTGLWEKLSGFGAGLGDRPSGGQQVAKVEAGSSPDAPAPVCIRRGTALNCQ